MSRAVSLAMYDVGGLATATLWQGLREHLADEDFGDLPDDLELPADYEAHWLAPDLLLAQTCGYPLRNALDGQVRYLGTPVYDVPGTAGAYYRSAIVVRAGDPATELADLRGRRAAYNSVTSQSGYNAFRDLVTPLADGKPFFSNVVQSGSHAASIELIITDKADIAAIDPVSLALTTEKIRSQIKVIGWSNAVPGLPLITAASSTNDDVNRLNRAITHALRDPLLAGPLAYLKLTGFEILPEGAYDCVPAMERRAIDRGYPLLA
jgi:ABC-type phosphate/phosphonate transport system substrate-binding protein